VFHLLRFGLALEAVEYSNVPPSVHVTLVIGVRGARVGGAGWLHPPQKILDNSDFFGKHEKFGQISSNVFYELI